MKGHDMRSCNQCGASIDHMRKTANYCSSSCRNKHKYQQPEHREKQKRQALNYYQENRAHCRKKQRQYRRTEQGRISDRASSKKYHLKNKTESNKRWSARWYEVQGPRVSRVLGLFQRGTERQRERLANRLLSQFDPTVKDHKVDQWLADYNSLE